MERDRKMRKRFIKWAVLFFLFMGAFTCISRVSSGLTIAKVITAQPEGGTIAHEVSGSGEVKQKQELAVITEEGLAIKTVCVTKGQSVRRDDPLYKLDLNQLDETIFRLKQELESRNKESQESQGAQEQVMPTDGVDDRESEKKLAELQVLRGQGGVIKAMQDSVVTEVNVKTGDKTTGAADLLLADLTEGVRIIASFSSDERAYLVKGAKVNAIAASGAAVDGLSIKAVSEDQENPESLTVTADLFSDKLDIGMAVEVSAETESRNYDCCIDREALHQSTEGGYYVYVISEKDSILGPRLEAVRAPVEVLDKNDTEAAVEGLTGDQEVIVRSSKDLEENSPVRRQES